MNSQSDSASKSKIPWPHAPTHKLGASGTYFVTAGTYLKAQRFRSPGALTALHNGLLKYASEFGWNLEAWAVFSNHYHFVAHSPMSEDSAQSLKQFLQTFHSKSAIWLNKTEGASGRKVWHNFWETRLTYRESYLARLNYVHQNPVKHGLVTVANQYKWCSANWFEGNAFSAQIKTIYSFDTDTVNVQDSYEPIIGD